MVSRQPQYRRVRLSEWALKEGISRITAYRMLQKGLLPVKVERSPTGRWYVMMPTNSTIKTAIYARATASRHQTESINRQISSLSDWANEANKPIFTVVKEIANPLDGRLPNLEKLLADSQINEIVIHNPDIIGLGRLYVLNAALAPQGRSIRALNAPIREDDLQQMIEEISLILG
ncbi:MAG: hypothetical protein OXC62_00640 [Aestuariivita sp.]|nr:hypothetical protein [Aestuariivita sp.]